VRPGRLGPAGMQSLHLQIDGDLSPSATAKAAGLPELAAQFTIRPIRPADEIYNAKL